MTQTDSLDPSKLTFRQILGALTIAQISATIGICFAAVAACVSLSFWLGQVHAESVSAQKLAELTGGVNQGQLALSTANQQIDKLSQSNAQLLQANGSANAVIASLQQQLSALTVQRGGQSNCDFIHAEIQRAQNEIEDIGSGDAFVSHGDTKEERAAYAAELEARIAGYQQQLGTCGSGGGTQASRQ